MSKKLFSVQELESLPAEEVIERIRYDGYSLLDSVGASDLRKEMALVGKVCHVIVSSLFAGAKPKDDPNKQVKNIRKKLVKMFAKLAPADYKKKDFREDTKNGLVIGFNHPSLGEILRLIALKIDVFGDSPMLFPVNLPWYEAIARDFERLKELGIIITPTITPSTWKKMKIDETSQVYEGAKRLKRNFREIYTKWSEDLIRDGGLILVAPSATRQRTVFKTKAAFDENEDIIPTMSVLALRLFKNPEVKCDFLPVAILPPKDFKRGLNLFKRYQVIPAEAMTANEIRKKYFKQAVPERLEHFDHDFLVRIAAKLPKDFSY